jgi:LacI family transcriptional regulator, repressor for deo operon, udp, cdd, tsx, nupC, and nupG
MRTGSQTERTEAAVSATDEGRRRSTRRRPTRGRATIDDVAQAAGVSTATVSRVLSGSTAVTPELIERVTTAVAALSYQPSGAARGLALGTMRNLGVVLPDLGNDYFFEVVKYLHRSSITEGYRTLIADHSGDPTDELATVRDLLGQVDGLVMISSRIATADLKVIAHQPTPVVLVNRVELGVEVPMVAVDTYTAMMKLCGHLASLGHRRVVYVSGSEFAWQNRERWKAVQTSAGLFGFEAGRVDSDGTIDGGYAVTAAALESEPTALICFNDLAAVGVLSRLRELGVSVPQDVSVTGFDDVELARHLQPRLTTVVSPKRQLGEQTWVAMAAAVSGELVPESIMIAADLVIRESTGPAVSR